MKVVFTREQLGELYETYYDSELDYYIDENNIYYCTTERDEMHKIGDFQNVLNDLEYLKNEWRKETMKNYEIKTATAIYTGGGIYIYYGQLENGLYFRTGDSDGYVSFCDSDTSVEDADYVEFYDEHEVDELQNYDAELFYNDMLQWIIDNAPDGNYLAEELEKRFINHNETNIEIENAHELERSIQEQAKQEKFDAMMSHQMEMIKRAMGEYGKSCRFIFNDSDQYRRDFEKQWKSDFYRDAIRIFKRKGYRIDEYNSYNLITW